MQNKQFIGSVYMKVPPEEKNYLHELPAVQYLIQGGEMEFTKNVTFFVGENGTGKSTLLEAIAVAYGFNAEGGTKNYSFHSKDSHSELWNYLTLVKQKYSKDGFFLRAESFYNAASYLEEVNESGLGTGIYHLYGGDSLHHQSHGESFLALIQNRFWGDGIYILDEPEAALSPMKLMTLLIEIDKLVKKDSQFIIATHSPILMAFPNAQIYQFGEKGVQEVLYKETEHYQLSRRFLENPERMLKYLLEE
jgi:Predicted ATPase